MASTRKLGSPQAWPMTTRLPDLILATASSADTLRDS